MPFFPCFPIGSKARLSARPRTRNPNRVVTGRRLARHDRRAPATAVLHQDFAVLCRCDPRLDFRHMRLTAAITHEAHWYVARCLEVEVASQGENVEEALNNLREALELYFEDAPVPDLAEPPIIASVDIAA